MKRHSFTYSALCLGLGIMLHLPAASYAQDAAFAAPPLKCNELAREKLISGVSQGIDLADAAKNEVAQASRICSGYMTSNYVRMQLVKMASNKVLMAPAPLCIMYPCYAAKSYWNACCSPVK